MEMYNVHQDATLLPIEIKTNDYILGNEKLPSISVSASKDQNGLTHISLVNIDGKNVQDVEIDIRGARFTTVTGRILNSEKLQDHNTFEAPEKVKPASFKEAVLSANTLKVKLPAHSVIVLELK